MTPHFGDGRDWFLKKRFGLFVHWGLYAVPAWHEQIQYRRHIPRLEYGRICRAFNPTRFDPDAWLDLAEASGMRYICFTTKHIDGFCMWDTAETAFKVTNTPYARDVLRLLSDACQRRSFPLCLYYSIVDNHHPNYPNRGRAHELVPAEESDTPDATAYLQFVKAQIRELCTEYGEIHGVWWDANRTDIQDDSVNEMIHSLQPKAVINNRGFDRGDIDIYERDYDPAVGEILAFERPTEACQAVGQESWGYRADEDYYTAKYLIQSVDRMMAKGANYLLNIGPKADGTVSETDAAILRSIGAWYRRTREALEGVRPASHLTANRDVLLTRRDDTLYVHLFRDPPGTSVVLQPLRVLPEQATLLRDGTPLETRVEVLPRFFQDAAGYLQIRGLPTADCHDTVMVLKLRFAPGVLPSCA